MTVRTEMDRDYLHQCDAERSDEYRPARKRGSWCAECWHHAGMHAPGCPNEPEDDSEGGEQ